MVNKIKGVVLSDQLKSLDWKIINAELIAKMDKDNFTQVLEKIKLLIVN